MSRRRRHDTTATIIDDDDEQLGRILSRREALVLLGGAAAVLLPACASNAKTTSAAQPTSTSVGTTATTAATTSTTAAAPVTTVAVPAPSCVVKPELTEGPYFVDEKLNRSDIRPDPSGGPAADGVPLQLAFRVSRVASGGCTALSGATVDVWQCDATGVYSDVSANRSVGKKFLRGYQTTDANGTAAFTTIYPGWYMGRAVHIHFKIRTAEGHTFTSQLFFDEAVTDTVHAKAPYNTHGKRDTTNATDSIYRSAGSSVLLPVTPDGSGYTGTFDVGLQI
jgi:protocatechuate 3,4-dioxygenase beta subunit